MKRLIGIELFKLRHTTYFWVLSGLFLLFLLSVPFAAKVMLTKFGANEMIQGLPIDVNKLPIFDFVDIWQNLTWVYKSFSIFLGFIIVISVGNEYSYGTVKQNVIDGLSRKEFLWSKIGFILLSSAIASLAVVVIGLIMGFMWSAVTDFEYIVKSIEFIPAYFVHLVTFQMFCLIVTMFIKRSGIVIALLIFYNYIIEPIIASIIKYHYKLEWLGELLPTEAMGNVIRLPFTKYAFQETQTTVGGMDLLVLLVYLGLFMFLAHRMIMRRDMA